MDQGRPVRPRAGTGRGRPVRHDQGRVDRRIAGPLIAALLWAGAAGAQQIAVPSGLEISLYDVILDADSQVARFRFLVPDIAPDAGNKTFGEVIDDLQFVCDSVIVPALHDNGWASGDVVLSVSDRPVDFGAYDSQVVQFFQPFRLEGDTCVWEDF